MAEWLDDQVARLRAEREQAQRAATDAWRAKQQREQKQKDRERARREDSDRRYRRALDQAHDGMRPLRALLTDLASAMRPDPPAFTLPVTTPEQLDAMMKRGDPSAVFAMRAEERRRRIAEDPTYSVAGPADAMKRPGAKELSWPENRDDPVAATLVLFVNGKLESPTTVGNPRKRRWNAAARREMVMWDEPRDITVQRLPVFALRVTCRCADLSCTASYVRRTVELEVIGYRDIRPTGYGRGPLEGDFANLHWHTITPANTNSVDTLKREMAGFYDAHHR